MKSAIWVFIPVLLLGGNRELMTSNRQKETEDLARFLPQEIEGWKAEGEDEFYDPQTIFDYINGAGEVYRSYNFKGLLARRFKKETKPLIIVDFFEMSSSQDAFGVFSHDLEGEEAGIGQGSTYKGGLLSFWKDRFFVSVYAEEEEAETRQVLYALAERIASAIQREGEKPLLLAFLPRENLDERRVHYFHNHLILNYHFFIAEENILLLDQESEAALAEYSERGEKSYLLLLRYPDLKRASQALESFERAYMPDAVQPGLVQTEDKKWTGARAKENFVIVVFSARSSSSAREMMEKVEKRLEKRK